MKIPTRQSAHKQVKRVQSCKKGEKMHKKCFFIIIIINESLPPWKRMHKDMGEKNKCDKHSGPKQNTATTLDLQPNRQHPDCIHTLFFQFLLLLPSPTGRVMKHKKYET